MSKLLILIASLSIAGAANAAPPPPADATPSPVATAPVAGESSDVVIQDKAQVEEDRRAIAVDRDKLRDASAQLQHDRDKMVQDQRKLDQDRHVPGPKHSFWHRDSAPAAASNPHPAPPQQAAPAASPGGPVPAEMQSQPPSQ